MIAEAKSKIAIGTPFLYGLLQPFEGFSLRHRDAITANVSTARLYYASVDQNFPQANRQPALDSSQKLNFGYRK